VATITNVQCPKCQASVPVTIRKCPCCKTLVNPAADPDPVDEVKSQREVASALCLAFGAMILFFSIAAWIVGVAAGSTVALVIAIALTLIGAALIAAFLRIRKRTRAKVEEVKLSLRVQCEYCGGMNSKDSERCAFCSAPLW